MISLQATIANTALNLQAPSMFSYAPAHDGFGIFSLDAGTTDETISYGDLIDPRVIALRLMSGDDVQVGFATGVYPMRLSGAGDFQILRLDVEGIVETSTAVAVADVAGSLNDKYFTLADRNGEVKVVITNDGVTALTSSGRLVVVTIADDDAGDAVASAIVAAFAADVELAVSAVGDLVTFTDKHTGTRTNIAAGDSGFTVATVQQGADSPVIHLKSTGTSQVLVAVAPN